MTLPNDATHQTATLAITGMTCGHCVAAVRKALDTVPGVSDAAVSVGSATFAVDANDRARVLSEAVTAIADAGYTATP